MEMINLHIWDNLGLMDIGDKAYLGKLEIIDKNENTLVCSDSSNSPEYYDMKGYCLSSEDEDLNISSYEAKYIFPDSSFSNFSELTALMLEKDLNLLCQDRIRKLMICHNSLKIRLPACISRHFKFSIDKGSNNEYILEITVPNESGSMYMDGLWTGELSFPLHPSDPSKIIIYREEISKKDIDIYIEDTRATDWGKYNGRQF